MAKQDYCGNKGSNGPGRDYCLGGERYGSRNYDCSVKPAPTAENRFSCGCRGNCETDYQCDWMNVDGQCALPEIPADSGPPGYGLLSALLGGFSAAVMFLLASCNMTAINIGVEWACGCLAMCLVWPSMTEAAVDLSVRTALCFVCPFVFVRPLG